MITSLALYTSCNVLVHKFCTMLILFIINYFQVDERMYFEIYVGRAHMYAYSCGRTRIQAQVSLLPYLRGNTN